MPRGARTRLLHLPASRNGEHALRRFFAGPDRELGRGQPLPPHPLRLHGYGIREWMDPGMVDRPEGTGDWLLMAFQEPVRVGVEGGLVDLPGGALLIWSPEQGHLYGTLARRWCHSWFHLGGGWMDTTVAALGLVPGLPIRGFDAAIVDDAVAAVHREIERHHPPEPGIVAARVEIVLREAARLARSDARTVPAPLLAVRRQLDAAFAGPVSLAALARRAGCSPQHLCTAFRRRFGLPPIAYAMRLRLNRARLLLAERGRRVAEVAAAVGYDDPRQFARVFKRRFGVAPGALRGSG